MRQGFLLLTLNGFYNFARNSNGAGFTLFNQTYGPSGSVGVTIPLFNGDPGKKAIGCHRYSDKKPDILPLPKQKMILQTALTNAYINYNNSLKAIDLEKNNLVFATENII